MAASFLDDSTLDTSAKTNFKSSVSWEDALNLYLTKESPTTKRRLKLKIPDTVFLLFPASNASNAITNKSSTLALPPLINIKLSSWTHTSKRDGEVAQRNDVGNLDLRHVCERFCRIALSNRSNARSSRFVAFAHLDPLADESNRAEQIQFRRRRSRLITAENFKLAIQGNPYEVDHIENTLTSLRKAKYLQCYIHPHEGEHVIYRATVTAVASDVQKKMLNNLSSSAAVLEVVKGHDMETIDGKPKDACCPLEDFIFFSVFLPNINKITYRISLSVFDANNHCNSSTMYNAMDTMPISLSNWKEIKEQNHLDHVRDLIGTATEELIRHITSFPMETPFNAKDSHSVVEYMIMDYILDDSRHLWLSSIPAMHISCSASESILVPETGRVDSQFSLSTHCEPVDGSNKEMNQQPHAAPSEVGAATTEDTRKLDGELMSALINSTAPSLQESLLCNIQGDELNATQIAPVPVKLEGQFLPAQEAVETKTLNEPLPYETVGRASRLEQTVGDCNDRYFYKELANLKKDVVKSMQHKEEEHRQVLLEVQLQLSLYKAECSCMKAKLQQLGGGYEETKDMVMGGHLLLVEKLQQLHQEMATCQRKWGEEKRSILSANAAAQQEILAQHRIEVSQLRSIVESYEDEILAQSNSCKELEKEKATLRKQLDDSTKKMHETSLLLERLKTENDINDKSRNRQGLSNKGMPVETCDIFPELGSEKNKSTNESDVRSLVNKLEYMKAQLESETKLKDGYVAAVELLRSEKDIMLSTNQERYRALEDQKNKELSLIRQQLTGANDVALKEISILKEQVGDLQVKLGDTVRGLARAQHREALARREAENEKVALDLAYDELSKARIELDGYHRVLNQNDSTSTAINEAILRRAENERQYLTAQLESETALKKELMEKLIQTEQMVLELKTSWEKDTQILKEKLLAETTLRTSIESELRGKNQHLISEVEDHRRQIEELKQIYTKVREQFKLEQSTKDQLRDTNHRLLKELHALQDELIHAKKVTEETITRHTDTTSIISTSMEMADETYSKKIDRLQEEANAALNEATKAKRELLQLQFNYTEQKHRLVKNCGSQMLLNSLICILRYKKLKHFSQWIRLSFFDRNAVECVEKNIEKKTIQKFERLLVSTMRSVFYEQGSDISALQEHFDRNLNLGEDKKGWISVGCILSGDDETYPSPWHETGLRLRTIFDKMEEKRKRSIDSLLEEEEVKRDRALQMVTAKNAKLFEQITSSHQEDVNTKVMQAVDNTRHEEEIENKRFEEALTETKSLLIKLKSESRAEVDLIRVAADKSIEKIRAEAAANAEHERESWLLELSKALNAQAVKNSSDMEEVLKTAEQNFLERMDCALAELQTACELEKMSEIRSIKDAYESQLAELKQALLTIQDDGQLMKVKLSDALSAAEESNDTIFDLSCCNNTLEMRLSFQQLRFFAAGLKYRARCSHEMRIKDDAILDAVEGTRLEFESKMQPLFEQIHTFESAICSYEALRLQMNDILIDYKREFLEEHQSKSKSVAANLQSISIKQEELDNRRMILMEQMKILEEKLRFLEIEMGELSKTSTVQGGRINVAHANRKRRMNEEFENLLDDIESRKKELCSIDESIRDLLFQKDETDHVMKALEKSLVEVLVEQQKSMLGILHKFTSL